uniref:Endonuclease NucS n=1 Tax=Candidatus Methanogaster sp. ANME-2c ERB4 TaxID=2759911 RepID=A0A7G9YME5_9EURY|nr:endonuclease NucS [Methanosarcinales archaeon ANME-2c ERB4]
MNTIDLEKMRVRDLILHYLTNERNEHTAHRDEIIEYVRSSQPEHVKKGHRTSSGLTRFLTKLRKEGVLSTERLEDGNYTLSEEFEEENGDIPPYSVSLEKDLANYLANNPSLIEDGLELKGKEYDTRNAGRIDILCIDGNGDFVVVETKKGKESDKVVGQIQRYMGWVKRNLAKKGKNVRGIIIVNEFDEWLDYAVSVNENIRLLYYEVKFAVRDVPPENSTPPHRN